MRLRLTTTPADTQGSRNRGRRGNVIIESVFTILPTFALICIFVDVGLVLFRWSTLQNAVREGCRYAITFQTSGSLGQDASIKQVVEQYAMGLVKTDDNPEHIFVDYYSTGDLDTPIATGGNIPGNIVEVSIQNVSWDWIAPLTGTLSPDAPFWSDTPLNLTVRAADMLGGLPAGVTSVPR